MVDTITLSLNIRDPLRLVKFDPRRAYEWSPNIDHIVAGGRSKMRDKSYICHYRPQLEKEKRSEEYFPQVKLLEVVRRGGIQQYLYITFSAPKLVFGNNFNELTDDHLQRLCSLLSQQLRKMGVFVSPKTLRIANVSQIHYSKNFLLICQPIEEIFSILRKAQPPRQKNYRYEKYSSCAGGGQSVYIYTKMHGLCFYDKKAESRKNHGTPNKLYSDAWQLPETIDVLRVESRCNSPANIRKTLIWSDLPVPTSLTLEMLFRSSIAQAVLLKEFEIFRTYLPPLDYDDDLPNIIKSIKASNPTLSLTKIINASLLIYLINKLGSKEDVRALLGLSSATWYRRALLLRKLTVPPSGKSKILNEIERQLTDFIPAYYGGKIPP